MINPYVTGFPADPKSFTERERELGEIRRQSITLAIQSQRHCKMLQLLEIGGLAKLHSCIS